MMQSPPRDASFLKYLTIISIKHFSTKSSLASVGLYFMSISPSADLATTLELAQAELSVLTERFIAHFEHYSTSPSRLHNKLNSKLNKCV